MPSKFLAATPDGSQFELEERSEGMRATVTAPHGNGYMLTLTECLNLRDFFVNTYGLSDDNIKASKLYQDAVNNAVDNDPVKEPAPVPTIETVHILREQHREIARMISDLSTMLETTL